MALHPLSAASTGSPSRTGRSLPAASDSFTSVHCLLRLRWCLLRLEQVPSEPSSCGKRASAAEASRWACSTPAFVTTTRTSRTSSARPYNLSARPTPCAAIAYSLDRFFAKDFPRNIQAHTFGSIPIHCQLQTLDLAISAAHQMNCSAAGTHCPMCNERLRRLRKERLESKFIVIRYLSRVLPLSLSRKKRNCHRCNAFSMPKRSQCISKTGLCAVPSSSAEAEPEEEPACAGVWQPSHCHSWGGSRIQPGPEREHYNQQAQGHC